MIFSGLRFEQVQKRTKTQTRRPYKAGDVSLSNNFQPPHQVNRNGRKLWAVGQDYAVCPGRGKPGQGRIKITAIRREPLGAITDDDAIREGMSCRDEFIRVWKDLYGKFDPAELVWVINFQLV